MLSNIRLISFHPSLFWKTAAPSTNDVYCSHTRLTKELCFAVLSAFHIHTFEVAAEEKKTKHSFL